MSTIKGIFDQFQKEQEEESAVKEALYKITREMDTAGRKVNMILQIIHQTADETKVAEAVQLSKDIFSNSIGPGFAEIEKVVSPCSAPPHHQYYDSWRHVVQKLSFLAALVLYLDKGAVPLYENVADLLCVKTTGEKRLCLELEDYLLGLLYMAEELSRLAVNTVTNGNCKQAVHISTVVSELAAGFRLLTFKNDFLRKKYDSLKYSVRKIEEVVYDLSVRGLIDQPQTQT